MISSLQDPHSALLQMPPPEQFGDLYGVERGTFAEII
jgi:hypothetical protein